MSSPFGLSQTPLFSPMCGSQHYTTCMLSLHMRETHAPGTEEGLTHLLEWKPLRPQFQSYSSTQASFQPHHTTRYRWPYCLSQIRLSFWHVHYQTCLFISKDYLGNLKCITFNSLFFISSCPFMKTEIKIKVSYCNKIALEKTQRFHLDLLLSLLLLFVCFIFVS